jgi:hypothetical protein
MNPPPDSDDDLARLVRAAVALSDAPPAWQQAARRLWTARQPPLRESVPAALRKLVAVLRFDSFAAAPAVSATRAAPAETRHLLFSALGRDIDVRIVPADAGFALVGQVLGPDQRGVVELAPQAPGAVAEQDRRRTLLDDLGEFRLEGVDRGAYVLTLRLGDDEIVLPPLDVGAGRG